MVTARTILAAGTHHRTLVRASGTIIRTLSTLGSIRMHCVTTRAESAMSRSTMTEMIEFCPVCGQPDNCGDCDHTPVPCAHVDIAYDEEFRQDYCVDCRKVVKTYGKS